MVKELNQRDLQSEVRKNNVHTRQVPEEKREQSLTARHNGGVLAGIEKEIEQKEGKISQTLNTIQKRLSFPLIQQLVEEELHRAMMRRIKTMATDIDYKTKKMGHNIVETIKHNPIPIAMLELGLSWLLLRGDGLWKKEYPEETEVMKEEARGKFRETISKAREKARVAEEKMESVAEQAKEKAKTYTHEARERLSKTKGELTHLVQKNPLFFGLAALTVGTVIGLSLSERFREH